MSVENVISMFSSNTSGELISFIISLLPVLELRGGILAASLLKVDMWKAYFICGIGTLIPIPIILLSFRQIFQWLKNTSLWRIADRIERKFNKKRASIEKYENLGLMIFVAIPLPGTGAWTGSMIAALMGMRFKDAFISIALGSFIADIIMCIISYGVLGMIF